MKGKCLGCPFNFGSELSEQIQNYGCLPTPQEIVVMRQKYNKTWACHSQSQKPCVGALLHQKKNSLEYKVVDQELQTEQTNWHHFVK